MTNFEIINYEPLEERPHPRAQAKAAIKRKKLKVDHPVCNQHAAEVRPSLEVDRILQKSLRLTDEELLLNQK